MTNTTAPTRPLSGWIILFGCTLASALLLYFSTGLGGMWLLAWFALAPLLWLAYGHQPLWRIALATFVAFTLGDIGFVEPFVGMPAATLGISMAVLALSVAAAGAICLARLIQRRVSWPLALVAFPALWVGIEYVSSLVSPNGTVGSLAYTQVGAPMLIQSASVFGIWAITFLICLVAGGIALALHDRRAALRIVAVVAIVFVANLLCGAAQLSTRAAAGTKSVALIVRDQPAERFASDRASWLAITSAYAREVQTVAASSPGLATVVLPEKLAVLQPAWRSAVLAPLAKVARVDHLRIVAGFEDDAKVSRNIAITFEPNGSTATYAKRRLLASEGNLTPGTKPGILPGGLAVEICKDMDFPQLIRTDAAGHHLGLVVVPAEDFTIDGWMHARVAVMRGVEDGFAVARSARKGDLTVSDDRGRLLAIATSQADRFVVRVVDVPVGSGNTIYLAIGDLFAWLCLGLFAAVGGLAIRGPAPR